jgi:hypothetical protein
VNAAKARSTGIKPSTPVLLRKKQINFMGTGNAPLQT